MANLKIMQWFIVPCVALVIVIGSVASCSSEKTTKNNSVPTSENTEVAETESAIKPMVVTVDELINVLDEDSVKAKEIYAGAYVKLTGKFSGLDETDKELMGFALEPLSVDEPVSGDSGLTTVYCNFEEKDLEKVMSFTTGQKVTIIGKITAVMNIVGYDILVESIK